MPQPTNYQKAEQLSNIDARSLDSVDRQLAAAQISATLAVADQIYDLVHRLERVADAVEGSREELPNRLAASMESLRQQIRTSAGS